MTLARAVLADRGTNDSWRLQSLTPLNELADYDDNPYRYSWVSTHAGAPAQPDGTPVYYGVPESLEKAKNDGERWRWALAQAAEADPGTLNMTRATLAGFLLSQFGTQTMAGSPFGGNPPDGGPDASGPYALNTLTDDETIARLATGIKRFRLPDEFNPIKIYQAIADDPKTGLDETALDTLATIFENRRKLDRAAQYLERNRSLHGNGTDGWRKARIDQILKPWGQFEPLITQPAGRGATVDFRFRTGRRVQFEAHEVLCDKLLKDVKEYISSSPMQVDWQQSDISDIGARVVARNQKQYLGRSVAQWNLDLEPPAGHLDRRITVTTPLQKAGAYLLTATIDGGNTARIIVWLDDTVIVKKPLVDKTYYFVADARTGLPVPRANVEMFGWRMAQVNRLNEFRVETKSLALETDDQGQVAVALAGFNGQQSFFQWLAIAKTKDGRSAHLGFSNVWAFPDHGSTYDQVKAYPITDRPVYRPGTSVRFKFWVARRDTISGKNQSSPASSSPYRSATRKGRRYSAGSSSRTNLEATTVRSTCHRTPCWVSIRFSRPSGAAGRSGSKSTRSLSSR